MAEYHVVSYDDVQLDGTGSVVKTATRKFLVSCTQRIKIFNPSAMAISPISNGPNSYENYPVLMNMLINFQKIQGLDIQLLDYSPQTVNTKIQSSATVGTQDQATKSSTLSATVGSVASTTNSYGATVSIGSVSGNYENSSTSSFDQSATAAAERSSSRSNDSSSSAGMSIKDWGAYALINPINKSPSWVFGQEYPWDAIECRRSTGAVNPENPSQVQIVIPASMALRLFDGFTLYPPSQLSVFGFDFVMKALWLVTVDNAAPDEVTIDHSINFFSGTHTQNAASDYGVYVYMDSGPTVLGVTSPDSLSVTVDLPLMGLDPLGWEDKAAIIGFLPRRFTVLPVLSTTALPVPFDIVSLSNNLMIQDTTGYTASCGPNAGFAATETWLSAYFTANCAALTMTVYFKIVDTVNIYTLYMKHWIATGTGGVKLTLVFNNDTDNALTKFVSSEEAEGGENNLLSVVLRDQDYSSVDYHDYLQLGLNSIQITITPMVPGATGCLYQIRAISVEKG